MAQQTFRTSLSGFNREDVVRYIEFLNAQHAAEISQLTGAVSSLSLTIAGLLTAVVLSFVYQ